MAPSTVSDKHSQNKRKASAAGIPNSSRPVKRRASKACCSCRARKVRCDVVESGSPCTNCRLDEVDCVVTESKRRKKTRPEGELVHTSPEHSTDISDDSGARFTINSGHREQLSPIVTDPIAPISPSQHSVDIDHGHVPHLIYQTQGQREHQQRRMSSVPGVPDTYPLYNLTSTTQHLLGSNIGHALHSPASSNNFQSSSLPNFIRPLPQKFQPEDIDYLETKGALAIPDTELRNELLRCYVLYVHTYMPLLDLDDFLRAIVRNENSNQLSLLLFQAVMFAGSAFIPSGYLSAAGFKSRKAARKTFFQRARLLYDFDYEVDRIALVQSLLLMTHWYEMPDDQKDTWHWMGVSLSLAHTIGLHRNPANSNMHPRRQKLWKRIWWSTYTRDRLIALGMRRPTRVKDEDCDVPLLTVDDYEIKPFSSESLQIIGGCKMAQDVDHQRHLALMFVEKAKLCVCISHVLAAQYSVLSHKFGGTTETTMMLVPKKAAAETCEVTRCDQELERWMRNLPEEARYRPSPSLRLPNGEGILHLHRALLRMVFLTTTSALHRPQVLPVNPYPTIAAELQDISRAKVRHAAIEITNIAQDLHTLDLTRYLPTTGVTVLLPAVIIHLLDVKSNDPNIRTASLSRFHQCMQILQRLRDIYASADFATSFLEAAIRKAGIQVSTQVPSKTQHRHHHNRPATNKRHPNTLTPPPESNAEKVPEFTYPDPTASLTLSGGEEPDLLLATTPPSSVSSEGDKPTDGNMLRLTDMFSNNSEKTDPSLTQFMNLANDADITQNDLDALINFDDTGADFLAAEDSLGLDMTLDSSKFTEDGIDWMKSIGQNKDDCFSDVMDAVSGEANNIDLDGASIKIGKDITEGLGEKGLIHPRRPSMFECGPFDQSSETKAIGVTGDLDTDIRL